MATNTLEEQPVQATENESMDVSSEDAVPDTKSGVRVDPNAALQSARFKKGDLVHMPVFANGMRTKVVFTIYDRKYNTRGGYVEYQLKNVFTMELHSRGAFIREKDLKAGS
ncbi:hypothetical protein EJ02DRAFT_167248 [Clathrospora elynae]|uniref:Uncharacterized protein n=1 Tax=Clathrospora elynae TaxID=706981 RepID=A0A6A5S271_9PLEO|nr:hypothetical protein EJ02DRAFT_167248 [Clathrospora elynae]